jgi:2-hydroxy-3-keto-5-methylthiopentenyl-1-phosphate phosphatase
MGAVLDLGSTSVFLDFDGTISTVDIGDHVAERLAPPTWRDVDAEYVAGEIGSRVALLELWDLLPHDEAQLRAVASEVPLDPGLRPLVDGLRAGGAEVTVVSDGFGFYADDVCEQLRLELLTNRPDWETGELLFPHQDRCCPCTSCGVCKQAPLKDAHRRGRTTVLVGDGASDRKAALLADVVFAKDALARWLRFNQVPFRPFTTLDDVRTELLG